MTQATVPLDPGLFSGLSPGEERVLLDASAGPDKLVAQALRYATGIPGLRLSNARGHVVVLPWMGQIVWDAVFDGVRLTMDGLFDAPRLAANIVDTYGCFAFHSGLLRNGCPGPQDTHALHGEFAVAAMDEARLVLTDGEAGLSLRVESTRVHAQGFGSRYRATAHVTLAAAATLFDIGLAVENTGGHDMELMYMCHINPCFADGARIVQPAPFAKRNVVVRSAVPAHVPTSPAYLATIARLIGSPEASATLDGSVGYDPEQVFYLHGLGHDAAGTTRLMLRRIEGDGFAVAFSLRQFPHVVRWLMRTADHRVAAFALPSTCEPEGFLAERRKGHVASLAPGETRHFAVRTGYVDRVAADAWESEIAALAHDTALPAGGVA